MQGSTPFVHGQKGQLLTRNGDVVMFSWEEAKSEDLGEDSFICSEGTEVIKRLPSGKALGVDEICPEGCRHCGAVLADTPLQCCMEFSDSACRVADWSGGSHFPEKRSGGCAPVIGVSNHSTLL